MKTEQREATRELILNAALMAISESGFNGISTRAIADRAKVSQGLLTYHFKSKEALWRAAADHLFAKVNEALKDALSPDKALDPLEAKRNLIRQSVYLCAAHPEFLRFMLEHGKENNERSRWIVDTHLRPLYQKFSEVMADIPQTELPHMLYILTGAAGLIFCAPNECKHLTGTDPRTDTAIEQHANYLANLIVPKASVLP